MPVTPSHIRIALHKTLKSINLDYTLYNTQSFHIGAAMDMMKNRVSIDKIKLAG